MSSNEPVPTLTGRGVECDALDRLLSEIRAGQSRVLVLRGEAGVGKTALLNHLVVQATDCQLASVSGVESEMELAYAALHQLCTPMLDRLDILPAPQREALRTAFGLSTGPPPDQFLVGLAGLGLLAATAAKQPLICIVDDAQWLDHTSAQTLTFVARRLLAEPVAMLFAVRETGSDHLLEGLAELDVDGLRRHDARALLESTFPGRLDTHVRDRIVAETHGNPLALLELTRGRSPGRTRRRVRTSRHAATGQQDRAEFPGSAARATRRHATAPARRRGRTGRRCRSAVARHGAPRHRPDAARSCGDRRVDRVRHQGPVPSSARSLGRVPFRERRRAPPESTARSPRPCTPASIPTAAPGTPRVPRTDPMRRWPASWSARRGGLGRAAGCRPGGVPAAGDRADARPERRAARALAAAEAKIDAAAPDDALELLATAERAPLDDLQRAQLARLRARIVFAQMHGTKAAQMLFDVAEDLESLDARLGARHVPRGPRDDDLRGQTRRSASRQRAAAVAALAWTGASSRRGPRTSCSTVSRRE